MKKLLLLIVALVVYSGVALAANPKISEKILTLGNAKTVLEQKVGKGIVAAVVVDASITASPATIFGVDEAQLVVVKGSGSLAKAAGVPLIIVLGTEEAAVWSAYAAAVQAAPELILAVLKGQTAVIGAVYAAESGAVKMLGAHPDLQVIAGKYLLGMPAGEAAAPAAKAETKAETPAATTEQVATKAAHGESAATAHGKAEAKSSGGGAGAILIFVIALIAAVIFMDKTVLK